MGDQHPDHAQQARACELVEVELVCALCGGADVEPKRREACGQCSCTGRAGGTRRSRPLAHCAGWRNLTLQRRTPLLELADNVEQRLTQAHRRSLTTAAYGLAVTDPPPPISAAPLQ